MVSKNDVINKVIRLGEFHGFKFLKKDIKISEFSFDKFGFVDSIIFNVKSRKYKWVAPILNYERGLGNYEMLYIEVNEVWIVVSEQ